MVYTCSCSSSVVGRAVTKSWHSATCRALHSRSYDFRRYINHMLGHTNRTFSKNITIKISLEIAVLASILFKQRCFCQSLTHICLTALLFRKVVVIRAVSNNYFNLNHRRFLTFRYQLLQYTYLCYASSNNCRRF